MSRILTISAICGGLILLSTSYETLQFNMAQFLPDISDANSMMGAMQQQQQQHFPIDMNYTSFLSTYHPERANLTAIESQESYLFDYFPDFCEDCTWGGGKTCLERANYLKDVYNTPEPIKVTKESRATCTNPPFKIFWQDSGDKGEVDNMFAKPVPQRGNITTSPYILADPDNAISIYVYDTLRNDVGIELETKMRAIYSQRNCSSANAWADIALIDLFRSYPGRVDDPTKANLFIVPYASASHCISMPDLWQHSCRHIQYQQIQEGVFDKLTHYKGNEKRHLFLNVINYGNSNQAMRNVHLSLNIGPRGKDSQVVVPYLNPLPAFQPSIIYERDDDWWTRPRTYALTYFFGVSSSSKMRQSARVWRRYFMEEVQTNWPDNLGGMPYVIRAMTRGKKPPSRFFTYMYEDSIFCPAFPGDTPPQKRFFDVILMGCIPVVMSFSTKAPGIPNARSWHQPNGVAMELSYPWAKGSSSIDPLNEIDYRSFVVEVKDDVKNVRPTIEALMKNYTEIRRLQLNLKKYAPYFSYGMGSDSHKYPDAFTKILESMKLSLARG